MGYDICDRAWAVMIPKSGQIPFRFPETTLSFDQMTITPAVRAVIAAIRRADVWPNFAFCLIGGERSGLTTNAMAWVEERNGLYFDHESVGRLDVSRLQQFDVQSVALDRIDLVKDDKMLLWLFSAVERQKARLLLTARTPPSQWHASSPDLRSRFKAMPIGELGAPDEEMMRARLRRACSLAYLKLPHATEDYLVTRLGLDYSLISDVITRLDGAAGQGDALTIPLVKEVLGLSGDHYDLFSEDMTND